MNKQPEIREKTRNELITAFWILYEKKNIDKIKIAELTNVAGYHRGTFYEYFKDIYDLLEQEEASLIDSLKSMVKTLYSADVQKDPIVIISEFYLKNGNHLNILITQGNTDFMNRFKETLYPVFLDMLKMNKTVKNRLIAEYAISGMFMTLHKWYEDGRQIPIEEFLKLVYSLMFHGVFKTVLKQKNNDSGDDEIVIPDELKKIITDF